MPTEIIGECIYCGEPIRGTAAEAAETDRPMICILCTDPRDHLDPADDDQTDTGL